MKNYTHIIVSKHKRYARGVALIIVLMTTAIIGLMLATSVPIAQVCSDSVVAHNERLLNYYLAESAVSRAQIMLINDLIGFSNRSILSSLMSEEANTSFYEEEDESVERVVADGSQHELEFEYRTGKVAFAEFSFDDAVSNFNFTGTSLQLQSRFETYLESYVEDQEKYEKMQRVYEQILDYVDNDDDKRDYGYERSDYTYYKLPNLPRNDAIETVEELMLIPGVREEIISVDEDGMLENVRVGLSPKLRKKFAALESSGGSGSFASASEEYLSSRISSTVTDLDVRDKISDAISNYRSEGTALYDNLDESELSNLRSAFSDNESGLYTLVVEATGKNKKSMRKIRLSFPMHSSYTSEQNFCFMLHRFFYIAY